MTPQPRTFLIAVVALSVSLLAACREVRVPFVYRIDIQQGNVIGQEQLAQLERGMDKRKVRFILGTPLVEDAFNPDRWDYYYSYEHGDGTREQRLISVFFDGEQLVRVGGNVRPAAGPIELPERPDALVRVPEGLHDEGLLAALTPAFINRDRRLNPKRPSPQEADEPSVDSARARAQTVPVSVSEADRRYLRELLEDYGRARADEATADTSADPGTPTSAAPDPDTESAVARWARRLGLENGGDDALDATPRPASSPLPSTLN